MNENASAFDGQHTESGFTGRAAVEDRYVQAARALALREVEFFALDAAGSAAKLECLGKRNKAAHALGLAERGVIGALWADGTLTHETRIGEAVRAVLAALREQAIGAAVA